MPRGLCVERPHLHQSIPILAKAMPEVSIGPAQWRPYSSIIGAESVSVKSPKKGSP